MKDLRLIDIVKNLVIGGEVAATREELVDIWNNGNYGEPATYELPAELMQNEN
jgi:hypothetical protein